MKFKKIVLVIAMACSMLIVTTGCIKLDIDIKVNADSSADMNITLLINDILGGVVGTDETGTSIEDIKATAEEAGFTATPQKEGDMSGYKFTRHVKNVNELSAESESSIDIENLFGGTGSDMAIFNIEKGLLKDTYTINLDMNLESLSMPSGEDDEFTDSLIRSMMAQMDFKFRTTLPIKTISNNASTVSPDGKTLEWQLIPGKNNTINMVFKAWNSQNILLMAGTLLVLILIATILLLVLKKKRKKKNSAVIEDVPLTDYSI
ncbi:MAG: LppM family (lipo)protein [Saccharofermentanales bacterium]